MLAIIDYDAGNIRSVEKACRAVGSQALLTRDPDRILSADHIILPGVGSFGQAMERLHSYGLVPVIQEAVAREIPFLGICLGLQLLFSFSQESPQVSGLGLLPGGIYRIPEQKRVKIPHIGWNSLSFPREGRLFYGLKEEDYVYFVHSYYLRANDPSIVTSTTQYGGVRMDSSVERGKLFACQFHPEKSSHVGLRILRNFLEV